MENSNQLITVQLHSADLHAVQSAIETLTRQLTRHDEAGLKIGKRFSRSDVIYLCSTIQGLCNIREEITEAFKMKKNEF